MPWPPTGATHYHTQLDFQTKVVQSKGWLFYYVAWLGSMGLWTSTMCVIWSLFMARMAIELKYCNTP